MIDPQLRQRAQAQLDENARQIKVVDQDLSPEAARAMLHELQVHQIELEMQNGKLSRAKLQLELAYEQYVDLFDSAPVGYCTLSGHGLILRANLTTGKMLGSTSGQIGQTADYLVLVQ